jgi:hypothetical protein
MTVSQTLLEITGNVLVPPQLAFGSNNPVSCSRIDELYSLMYLATQRENPQHGAWNFADKQFRIPASLDNWAVVSYIHAHNTSQVTLNLVQQLRQCFAAVGQCSFSLTETGH